MTVVFRVDASSVIGSGHFMRCLALADVLSNRGVETRFVSRAHPGHLLSLLYDRAIRVKVLPASEDAASASTEDYATWLGASAEEDAAQTVAALNGDVPEWLIVDHYAIGLDWETLLRAHVRRLMVVDDLANRAHDCDVLVDQNFARNPAARYRDLVPNICRPLLGPRYALLASDYSEFRRTRLSRDGHVREVFIFFGGTDPNDMTGLALEALSTGALRGIRATIVVGAGYPYRARLEQRALTRPGTTIHGPRPHLADLIVQADLAIGGGGTTTWERMCLGVPSVVISTADNQRPACRALAEAGHIRYAGHWNEIDSGLLGKLVQSIIGSTEELNHLAAESSLLVDGHGASRVAEVLCPSDWSAVRIRPSRDAQRAKSLRFALEIDRLPLGQLELAHDGNDATLDLTLDEIAAERGWKARAVGLATSLLSRCSPALLNQPAGLPYLRAAPAGYDARPNQGLSYSIQILSDADTWMNESIPLLLAEWLDAGHRVLWVHDRRYLQRGDFCFLLGCGQFVPRDARAQFRHCLVVHESDLPKGKGWSPLTWQILEGARRIPVSLIEAADRVDSGRIYAQLWLQFEGHELIDELRIAVGQASLGLCRHFVSTFPRSADEGRDQTGEETFYPRRTARDSRLDLSATIDSQFGLLRVVDNERYPAYFERQGIRYELRVRKAGPA